MHKLVYKISKTIKINLQLYYYEEFSFEKLLKDTEKYKHLHSNKNIEIFNDFISKIKDNNIESYFSVNEYQKITLIFIKVVLILEDLIKQ